MPIEDQTDQEDPPSPARKQRRLIALARLDALALAEICLPERSLCPEEIPRLYRAVKIRLQQILGAIETLHEDALHAQHEAATSAEPAPANRKS